MKIASAYIRVSTDDQMEYSPDSQLEKIREYAKKNEMLLPEDLIFREDEGISGRKADKRPEFQRMIATAKQKPHPFEIILVWKFSRFARNQEESIVYKSLLRRECGIDVVSVSEPIVDGPFGSLIERMIEWMDEYYSTRLAGEVKRGMNEKVARGEPVSIPAFGYTIKNKKYIIDPDTAPLVEMIYNDYISGMGYRTIAEKLNSMGVRTKRGGLWENRTVEYILRNPVYIGKIRWNPERKTHRNYDDPDIVITDGDHEHLLDDATWKKAQARMDKNRALYGRTAGLKKPASLMLQGLVKCSTCGNTLSRSAGESMQCIGYAHGKCNVSHGIKIERLEAMVLTAIETDLESGNITIVQKPQSSAAHDADAIEKQLVRERQKLIRVKEAYENGIDTLDEYRVNKQKIIEQIKQLQLEQSTTTPVISKAAQKKYCKQHLNVLSQLKNPNTSAQEKNIILRSFVDHIVFDRMKCQVEIYYYL